MELTGGCSQSTIAWLKMKFWWMMASTCKLESPNLLWSGEAQLTTPETSRKAAPATNSLLDLSVHCVGFEAGGETKAARQTGSETQWLCGVFPTRVTSSV